MIGGYVVDMQKIRPDFLWLATGPATPDCESVLHVCVDPGSFEIREGDLVTWEGDVVRWTPRGTAINRPTYALKRVGVWNRMQTDLQHVP